MAKLPRKVFCEVLRRTILQNSCWKTSVMESVFSKIAGIDSRQQFNWKEAFTKQIFFQVPQNLHLWERSNMSSAFCKIVGCPLQGSNFIKILVQHRIFFQNFLLKTIGIFQIYSGKNLWWTQSRVAIFRLRLAIKINSIMDISLRWELK